MSAEPRVLSGRYRVDELIGRGGMASVHRGYDLTLGRDVAIKILDAQLAADAAFRMRFRLEAQAASRMSSSAIVRVYDAGEDAAEREDVPPTPYIVMELVHGRLLKDIIAAGPVPLPDTLRYVDGILEALEYSHRAGVVHRDIKPGNVMITDDGQVKVMDFGIARAASDSSSTVAETTSILGTAAYFSPEQAKGESVDARTDLYSTGIVLYELLTGRQPFRGDSPVAVAYQHVSETPQLPSEIDDTISRALDAVVLRALAKDPYQRFPDAATFREALAEAAEGRAPSRNQVSTLTSQLYGANPRQAAETARSLRQLSNDPTMKRTQAGPPVAWIWTGVAVLAVLLISVLIWVMTMRPNGATIPSGSRIIPSVAEMTYEQASEALADEDLVANRVDEPSDTVDEGDVTRTDPVAGTPVERDSQVNVYVSTGPDTVAVPELVGLSRAKAEAALKDAGLALGAVRTENDPDTKKGIVITAGADKGDELATGARVDLTVATGTVTVVDMTENFRLDDAVKALKDLKLKVTVKDDDGCTRTDPRTVTAQTWHKGDLRGTGPGEVPIHATVTLTSCSDSPEADTKSGAKDGDDTPSPDPSASEDDGSDDE